MRSTSARFAALSALLLASGAVVGCSSDSSTTTSASSSTGGNPMPDVFGPLGDRADLPVDERIELDHLSGPVDVVRDKFGRPHIYATTVNDALRVEGYLVAKDRHVQLEVLRRLAEGRLAELLGNLLPSLIDLDISYRHIGLMRTAKAQYAALDPNGEIRQGLDAYSDGITQAYAKFKSKELIVPGDASSIGTDLFTDWTGEDSLALGRLQTYQLSYDADSDISNQVFLDTARSTFNATAMDPLFQKRAGIERDFLLFAPIDPATTTTGYPTKQGAHQHVPAAPSRLPGLAALTKNWRAAMELSHKLLNPHGFGSNNWAVAPGRSATGHALVASDPHLNLQSPATFWPVSIDIATGDPKTTAKIAGVAFPGIPGIILGHNEHIGWGATVAGYDVSDAYTEKLTPDGKSVVFNGKNVALTTIDEEVKVNGKASIHYKVRVVPHHGPILPDIQADHTVKDPDPSKGAVSIRWTGYEPTNELAAVVGLWRAKNVDEARLALNEFGVGAQNWMLGDTDGNILWTSHAVIPTRDKRAFKWDSATYAGDLPCKLLPGDGTAEWTGKLDDALVPFEKNPKAGYMSTANQDPIGNTLDNDPSNDTLPDGTPMYLACSFDPGIREGRIHKRIESHAAPLSVADLQSIQADHHSGMGERLVPHLLAAIDAAEAERTTPGTNPDLTAIVADKAYDAAKVKKVKDLLTAWKTADFEAASGVDPATNQPWPASGAHAAEVAASQATAVYNTWAERFIVRVMGDEGDKIGYGNDITRTIVHLVTADPKTLATYDAATGDSAIFDDLTTPMVVESRHERMIRALLDMFADIPDLDAVRWGALHRLTLDAVIPLFPAMTIPPSDDKTFPKGFPRPGDLHSIDACGFGIAGLGNPIDFTYSHGPNQRFVIDLDPAGVKTVNAIPGGNVWDPASPHHRDEAELWRVNQAHVVPFTLTEVVAAKESRTVVSLKK